MRKQLRMRERVCVHRIKKKKKNCVPRAQLSIQRTAFLMGWLRGPSQHACIPPRLHGLPASTPIFTAFASDCVLSPVDGLFLSMSSKCWNRFGSCSRCSSSSGAAQLAPSRFFPSGQDALSSLTIMSSEVQNDSSLGKNGVHSGAWKKLSPSRSKLLAMST